MLNPMSEHQKKLDINFDDVTFTSLQEKGVPSATNPEKRYFPRYEKGTWVCDGPNGPCAHFRIHGTECRHIKEYKLIAFQELWKHICERIELARDIRDECCQSIDQVIAYMSEYKSEDVNRLSTLMLNLASFNGEVTTDDVHVVTNEEYYGNLVMGIVVRTLKQAGLIKLVSYRASKRKCAHSRPIGVYVLTEKGKDFIASFQTGKGGDT